MGIVVTLYEDSANNNIVFDSSKFDYDYDSDTFPADVATDVQTILLEMGDVFIVERETTTTDSMGAVSAVSKEDIRVYGLLMDITKKDRLIHDMGLAVPGNRKFFYKPSYTITSAGASVSYEDGGSLTGYTLKEGDVFEDRIDNRWRVIQVLKEHKINATAAFSTCIVRSIGLEGSE